MDLRGLLADLPSEEGHAPGQDQKYVNGWGVFALPFESRDVLALRVFPQNSFNPYVAIWHRDPDGRWAIYVDGARLDTSCPRYFGSARDHTGFADIAVTWTGPDSIHVQMNEPAVDWTLTAHAPPVLAVFNAVSRRLPVSSWRPRSLVWARERMARWFGLGDLQLQGVMPSGHAGRLMPEQMFLVDQSTARLDGRDLGRPIRLQENPSIGGFRLPARGVLVKGGAVWDILDPARRTSAPHRIAAGSPPVNGMIGDSAAASMIEWRQFWRKSKGQSSVLLERAGPSGRRVPVIARERRGRRCPP
jgi:hypothetical protein